MKILEKFTLVIYSYIVLILAVLVCLMVFNWLPITTVENIAVGIIEGQTSSKIALAVSAVLILLSIRCIFFDSQTEEKIKESQGILLKNENGQLLMTKETLDNMVKVAVSGFDEIKECNPKISVNEQNEISITLQIVINNNVVIKDLANRLQTKVKEEMKRTSDLDVKEVNVKVVNIKSEKNTKAEL